MAKLRFDDIEIVDPPLQELSKKPSLFKSGCLGGCGCLAILIVGTVVGWRLLLGSSPTTGTSIPKNFPSSIPLYDSDAIEHVTIIPGKYKGRRELLATTIPKIVMGPFTGSNASSTSELFDSLWQTLTSSSSTPDQINIEWPSPTVNSTFMSSYYKKELRQNDYEIIDEIATQGIEQFSFTNKEGIQGTFSAEPLTPEAKTGTYVILEVKIPTN
jgi:hypothetical protein